MRSEASSKLEKATRLIFNSQLLLFSGMAVIFLFANNSLQIYALLKLCFCATLTVQSWPIEMSVGGGTSDF